MGFSFEGSIDDISENQLAFIGEVLNKRGYNNTTVTIDPVGAAGDNYAANVKRITVSDGNDIFKMIAKIAPQSEMIRLPMNVHRIFKNEDLMYNYFFPKFEELQTNAEVPDEDRLKYAACYGSLLEQPNELILFEDLKTSNFVILDKFKPLSNECVKSVLKNLAIFHSLSYVLKIKEPETFKALKGDLFDMRASVEALPEAVTFFNQLVKDFEKMIEGEDRKEVLRNSTSDYLSLNIKLAQSEVDCKHSVIQHGDCWTNNFMFQFHGDSLHESIIIDYQMSKESNPTRDILYMIFNCTDHETRLKHFHDWIDYYHSELDRSLSNFRMKASYVYSRDQLNADMKTYIKIVFTQSLLALQMLNMQSDDAKKFKEKFESNTLNEVFESMSVSNYSQNFKNLLTTKVLDIIDSYLVFGLLLKFS